MLAGENNKNHKHKPEHCASAQALQQRTEDEWGLKKHTGHKRKWTQEGNGGEKTKGKEREIQAVTGPKN